MKLTNIRLAGNEDSGLRPDTIYAELLDDKGLIVIGATLEYILSAIRDRGYTVEGVEVIPIREDSRSSKVKLLNYK